MQGDGRARRDARRRRTRSWPRRTSSRSRRRRSSATAIRVRYNECDPQGLVFNANYLAYFDLAMTELWREASAATTAMIDDGVDMVVAEAERPLPARRSASTTRSTSSCARSELGNTSMTSELAIERGGERRRRGRASPRLRRPDGSGTAPIPAPVRAGLERYSPCNTPAHRAHHPCARGGESSARMPRRTRLTHLVCGLTHVRAAGWDDEAIAALAVAQHGVVARLHCSTSGSASLHRSPAARRPAAAIFAGRRAAYAVGHEALSLPGRALAGVIAAGPGSGQPLDQAALHRLIEKPRPRHPRHGADPGTRGKAS